MTVPKGIKTCIGFDLGHGESCLAMTQADITTPEKVLEINNQDSIVTAIGRKDGDVLIGNDAVSEIELEKFDIGFKSKPSEQSAAEWIESAQKIKDFASECFRRIEKYIDTTAGLKDVRVLIGFPTAWSDQDRDLYRAIFREAGLPNADVARESRAALIHFRDSQLIPNSQLDTGIVVIDIGSSTTDATFIANLEVQDVVNLDESTRLGAGLIEKFILGENKARNCDLSDAIEGNGLWKNQVLLICRRLKEDYFKASAKTQNKGARQVWTHPVTDEDIVLKANSEMMDRAFTTPMQELNGASWSGTYQVILENIKERIGERQVGYVILTGGASRMPCTYDICREVFGKLPIKSEAEPETAVAIGLAQLCRWEHRCAAFEEETKDKFSVDYVVELTESDLSEIFFNFVMDSLEIACQRIIPECLKEWREGKIQAKHGLVVAVRIKSEEWSRSDEYKNMKDKAVRAMLERIRNKIQEDSDKICEKFNIEKEKRLVFHLDLGRLPIISALDEMLDDSFIRYMDKLIGWIVDNILPRDAWVTDLAAFFVRAAGEMAAWSLKAMKWVGEQIGDDEIVDSFKNSTMIRLYATNIHEQLHKQFDEQLEKVKIWIK